MSRVTQGLLTRAGLAAFDAVKESIDEELPDATLIEMMYATHEVFRAAFSATGTTIKKMLMDFSGMSVEDVGQVEEPLT